MNPTPMEFVTLVVRAYNNRQGVFATRANAEDLLPDGCTPLEKGQFLFYVIQLDYATKSQRLYRGATELWQRDKSFFEPTSILTLEEDLLRRVLQENLKPRYVNEAVRRWRSNSEQLLRNYSGDPRKIFSNAITAQEALKRVRNFRGFGPKIGNFFVRVMINVFGYDYPDVETLLPPVDVWDVRIAFLMGYTDSDKMSRSNIYSVKRLWSQACADANLSWLIFDKALWLLGSEGKPKAKEDILSLMG